MNKRRRYKAKARRKLARDIRQAGGRLRLAAQRLRRAHMGRAIGMAMGNALVPGGYGVIMGAIIGECHDRSSGALT